MIMNILSFENHRNIYNKSFFEKKHVLESVLDSVFLVIFM